MKIAFAPLSLSLLLVLAAINHASAVEIHIPEFYFNKNYTWPQAPADGARISVGYEASQGQFPTIAAVYLPGALCGGTLISPRHVITAAHCVVEWTDQELIDGTTLYIGLLNRNTVSQCNTASCATRAISAVTVHPDYNPSATVAKGDLAILTLASPVNTITPSALSTAKPSVKSIARVAGWGLEAATDSAADALMWTDLQTASDATCTYDPNFYYAAGSICEKSYGDWPQYTASACKGDSGGPLFYPGSTDILGTVAYGIIENTGEGCGKYIQTVFMNVAFYKNWIYSIIGNPSPPPPGAGPKPPPPRRPPPPKSKPSPPPPAVKTCRYQGNYRIRALGFSGTKYIAAATSCSDASVTLRTSNQASGTRIQWALNVTYKNGTTSPSNLKSVAKSSSCTKRYLTSPTGTNQPKCGTTSNPIKYLIVPVSISDCSVVNLVGYNRPVSSALLGVKNTSCGQFVWGNKRTDNKFKFKLIKV